MKDRMRNYEVLPLILYDRFRLCVIVADWNQKGDPECFANRIPFLLHRDAVHRSRGYAAWLTTQLRLVVPHLRAHQGGILDAVREVVEAL
ncbi:hypothetical protein B5F41_06140, partial [Gordonibacter sp. An232A]